MIRTGRRGLTAAMLTPAAARAEFAPTRPIRLLIPLAAGTYTDVVARIVAEPLGQELGVPVVPEIRSGANGAIAAQALLREAADGHTLLLAGVSMLCFNKALYARLSYDPERDLELVAPVGNTPLVLVASNRSGIASLAELPRRGRLTYASLGNGHATHLAMEMLIEAMGITATHVPFSTGPALPSLFAGDVDLVMLPVGAVLPHLQAGRLRAVAFAGARRHAALPATETFAEAGIGAPDCPGWYALVGPAGMPAAVVDRCNAACDAALARPGTLAQFERIFLEPMRLSPAALRAMAMRDTGVWGGFIERRGLRIG